VPKYATRIYCNRAVTARSSGPASVLIWIGTLPHVLRPGDDVAFSTSVEVIVSAHYDLETGEVVATISGNPSEWDEVADDDDDEEGGPDG